MTVTNVIQDKAARLALSYGKHIVRGHSTKNRTDFVGTVKRVRIQQAVGLSPWNTLDALYYDGELIDPANYIFHTGESDAPDANFPDDIAHPDASYYSALLPEGIVEDNQTDKMAGIFRCLKTNNYDGAGAQTAFDYSASPARHVIDIRNRAGLSLLRVNWPVWVDWRDYCAESITWDDGKQTPHDVTLTAGSGGTLAANTYYVRVTTFVGADESSGSVEESVVIDGISTNKITVDWTAKTDATAQRVYIGTSAGGQDKYFALAADTESLVIDTLGTASAGSPPAQATGALLRSIPRFESHLFLVPPFSVATAINRIAQISCMDWQWSGGKLVFMTPEIRTPVFTVDMTQIKDGSFKAWQIDRRSKFNQIIVSYRDLDDEFLTPADPPVTIERLALQAKEGIRTFEINLGTGYRSQAERVGHFWARRLIDSDYAAELSGSPRTYHVLPGDVIDVSHDVPNWADKEFMVERKEENEDVRIDYPMTLRLYGAWYSDTDQNPLPRPERPPTLSPFVAPPVVVSVTLSESGRRQSDGTFIPILIGAVEFDVFGGNSISSAPFGEQRGRVWVWGPSDSAYEATDILLVPHPATLESAFELPGVVTGLHKVKVVTESRLGVSGGIAAATEYTITILGIPPIAAPTGIIVYRDTTDTSPVRSNFQIVIPPRAHAVTELVKYWVDAFADTGVAFTVDVGTDVCTSVGHGLIEDQYVALSTAGTLPQPLDSTFHYYVRDVTTDTFKLTRNVGDSAVNITDTGTGTHSFTTRKRHMPVLAGTFNAALFDEVTGTVETAGSGGWLKTIRSLYHTIGNVYSDDGATNVTVFAFNEFTEAGSAVEFQVVPDFTWGTKPIGGGTVSLMVGSDISHQMVFSVTDFSVAGTRYGLSIKEASPPSATPSTVYTESSNETPGTRYRIQISGSEIRYYRNYAGAGTVPIFRSPIGVIYPVSVRFSFHRTSAAHKVMLGGLPDAITTYPKSDQTSDFGTAPEEIRFRVYEERTFESASYFGAVTDFIT